jgi:predicted ArsR family transcriptional regulator
MKTTIDKKDRQFLDELHRLGGGTIQEICDDQGVTATAIRQRLSRLQGQALITRDAERFGRGRPRFVYHLTDAGHRALGENYSDLAMVLWNSIRNIEDDATRSLLLGNVQDEMIRRYGRSVVGKRISERFQELGQELGNRGFQVEIDNSGDLPILRENSCPYWDLASTDPEICRLEQSVFEKILGTSVDLMKCSLDGENCCEFHVTAKAS